MDDFTMMDGIVIGSALLFAYWSYLLFKWVWEDPFYGDGGICKDKEEQDDD